MMLAPQKSKDVVTKPNAVGLANVTLRKFDKGLEHNQLLSRPKSYLVILLRCSVEYQ